MPISPGWSCRTFVRYLLTSVFERNSGVPGDERYEFERRATSGRESGDPNLVVFEVVIGATGQFRLLQTAITEAFGLDLRARKSEAILNRVVRHSLHFVLLISQLCFLHSRLFFGFARGLKLFELFKHLLLLP